MRAFYGDAWRHQPVIEVENCDLFSAVITCEDNLVVRVSAGCLDALERLRSTCDVAFSIDHAFEWLLLHELHHADLAHFDILEGKPSLHLVTRSKRNAKSIVELSNDIRHKVSTCLELQADHDALEMMLSDYSASDWASVRTQATSIAAVLVLIEKADGGDGDKPSTHPLAATRIFQLLGHVAEMWSIPAHAKANTRGEGAIRDKDLPPQVVVQAFSSEVVLPVFWDAVALAEAADAKSIISDLGSPADFFADIGRAKLGQWDELVTDGAKEWAELKELNTSVLEYLGHSSI